MDRKFKAVLFWIIVGIAAVLLWQVVHSTPQDRDFPEISYSQFISDVDGGKIEGVTITGALIRGSYREGKGGFRVIGPTDQGVYLDSLRKGGVETRFRAAPEQSLPLQLLGTWAPLILLAALWFFMIRQMQRRKSTPSPGTGAGPIEPK